MGMIWKKTEKKRNSEGSSENKTTQVKRTDCEE